MRLIAGPNDCSNSSPLLQIVSERSDMHFNPEKPKMLRRIPPRADRALADALGIRADLKKYNLDLKLVRQACHAGDPAAIDDLGDYLVKLRNERRNLVKSGERAPVWAHGKIPDQLCKHLALNMLKACRAKGIPPSEKLTALVQNLFDQDKSKRDGPRSFSAMLLVAGEFARDPNVSLRNVARLAGVDHTTVRRWKNDPQILGLIEIIKHCP